MLIVGQYLEGYSLYISICMKYLILYNKIVIYAFKAHEGTRLG